MRSLVFGLIFAAGPAAALDVCDDLWFTRNLVFDRAGYCFGSVLGQAVFDNADCTTKSPNLNAADKAVVERVRAAEAEWGCKVDSGRSQLNVERIWFRALLSDLPIPSGYESACVPYIGAPTEALAGRSLGAEPVGRLEAGMTVLFEHQSEPGWEFIRVVTPEGPEWQGWVPLHSSDWPGLCEMMAG